MSAITYMTAWRTISARIHGLEKAASLHAEFLQVTSSSAFGADNALAKQCQGLRTQIQRFKEFFSDTLPAPANEAIDTFMSDAGTQMDDFKGGGVTLIRTVVVKLVAFESEVSYCLESPTEKVRSASELAFDHLQRLIVVDLECQKKWQAAFKKGETHCENLGGVHLLWHGIWAFKVNASGARTDLIYQEPLDTDSATTSLGLVLTEWKVSNNGTTEDIDKAYNEAKKQTDLYAGGVLAGLELTSHRYLVVVTKEQIKPRQDIVESTVTYRHVNIAVNPVAPSVIARKNLE